MYLYNTIEDLIDLSLSLKILKLGQFYSVKTFEIYFLSLWASDHTYSWGDRLHEGKDNGI